MAREIRPHGDIPHQNNSLRRRTYKSQFVLNLAKHKNVIVGSFIVVTIVVVAGVFLLGDSSSMDGSMSESTEKEVAVIETRLGKIVIEFYLTRPRSTLRISRNLQRIKIFRTTRYFFSHRISYRRRFRISCSKLLCRFTYQCCFRVG